MTGLRISGAQPQCAASPVGIGLLTGRPALVRSIRPELPGYRQPDQATGEQMPGGLLDRIKGALSFLSAWSGARKSVGYLRDKSEEIT